MQKVNYYLDIVDKVPSNKQIDKDNLKKMLLLYHEFTYHPNNISIMPCSGGINNLKQVLGFDRIDTFLFTLKQYYEQGISSYILNFGRVNMAYTEFREILKKYLDSFNLDNNGIYNYCREIYHIGDKHKKFINKLCDFGKKAILCPEDVETYLKLMTTYWLIKSDYYKSASSSVQTCYQKMLKHECEIRGKKYINSFTGTMDFHC